MGRKGSEISQDIIKVIVDLYKNGHKVCNITKLLNLPYMTVSNIVKRFLCSGSTENKPRSGRPKVVTDRDYRQLERLVKVNRRDSLSDITSAFNDNRNTKVSRRTVQYLLGKHGFHRRVARKRVIVKYKDILEDNIWPVIVRHFPDNNYLFQDGNAPVHRSRLLQQYKADNSLKSISWPAQSPDAKSCIVVW